MTNIFRCSRLHTDTRRGCQKFSFVSTVYQESGTLTHTRTHIHCIRRGTTKESRSRYEIASASAAPRSHTGLSGSDKSGTSVHRSNSSSSTEGESCRDEPLLDSTPILSVPFFSLPLVRRLSVRRRRRRLLHFLRRRQRRRIGAAYFRLARAGERWIAFIGRRGAVDLPFELAAVGFTDRR